MTDSDAVRRLERVKPARTDAELADEDDQRPADKRPTVRFESPALATVVLVCPNCDQPTAIEVRFGTRLIRDSTGDVTLGLRVKAPKMAHDCDQLTMSLGAAVAPRSMS